MSIRHNFEIEKFEIQLVQRTDYPKSVFANNMRVNHGRRETCCNGCKTGSPNTSRNPLFFHRGHAWIRDRI
jgi:hypothetical protein